MTNLITDLKNQEKYVVYKAELTGQEAVNICHSILYQDREEGMEFYTKSTQ